MTKESGVEKKLFLLPQQLYFAFGVPSGLSFGVLSDVKVFDMTFFDHVDNFASNYLLPLGGMLTAIFVGWIWGTKSAEEEIEKNEAKFRWGHIWGFLIRYITPSCSFFSFLCEVFLKQYPYKYKMKFLTSGICLTIFIYKEPFVDYLIL